MSNDRTSPETHLSEEITGVATVSQPEVGANKQFPIGQSPSRYQKRNKKEQKGVIRQSFREWIGK